MSMKANNEDNYRMSAEYYRACLERRATNGMMLGLKSSEFAVIEWRRNTVTVE
jgi:hypothetical protein